MRVPVSAPAASGWTEVIEYDASRRIAGVEVYADHVMLEGRQHGLTQLWQLRKAADGSVDAASLQRIAFDEELYHCGIDQNKDYATAYVRISYSSLTTPTRYIDLHMGTGQQVLIKEQPILEYDRSKYVCRRLFATAPDKTKIPISLVHRKDLYADDEGGGGDGGGPSAPKPTMLYGYGSYGTCMEPSFDRALKFMFLPYLDRGMIYAIAHVRGGGEMGRFWYEEQGKYLNKRNTFMDFVSCAEHLVDSGYTAPSLLAAEGRSAGGLLVGNVLNWRPDLFEARRDPSWPHAAPRTALAARLRSLSWRH